MSLDGVIISITCKEKRKWSFTSHPHSHVTRTALIIFIHICMLVLGHSSISFQKDRFLGDFSSYVYTRGFKFSRYLEVSLRKLWYRFQRFGISRGAANAKRTRFFQNSKFYSLGSKFGKFFLECVKKEVKFLLSVRKKSLRFSGVVQTGVEVWLQVRFRVG